MPACAAEEVARARTPAAGAVATGRTASPSATGPTGAPSRALTIGAKLLPKAARPSARARTQSVAVEAVLGLVRGLRFEHELGDVHLGVALVAAHLAVDAQVRDRLHLLGRRGVRVGEDAEQVRLRARGRGLRRRWRGTTGHMRSGAVRVRQSPHPLQRATSAAGSSPSRPAEASDRETARLETGGRRTVSLLVADRFLMS